MKKSKLLLSFVFVLQITASLFVFGSSAGAVDPGCYVNGGSVSTPVYREVDCPGDNSIQRGIRNDRCYVEVNGNFNVIDCDSLDVATVNSGQGVEPIESNFDDQSKGCNEGELTAENCRIIEYLVRGINVLSALAGMAIIASIMIAGFQYMTARDNSGQIQQARTRIIWAISALVILIFTYALLNFLVPGGVI